MAKQRLSRLQKWILLRISTSDWIENKRKWISRRWIYQEFWGLDIPSRVEIPALEYKIDNSKCVILSRSLKNLEDKGCIHLEKYGERHNYWGFICLTIKGAKKVKELMDSGLSTESFEKIP